MEDKENKEESKQESKIEEVDTIKLDPAENKYRVSSEPDKLKQKDN